MIRAQDAKASHCSCRDCRAVVLGPIGTLCEDCTESGCDAFYEPCRRPGAYAPRAAAGCACCAHQAQREGRSRRALCEDCEAAGCEWHHAECIRTDGRLIVSGDQLRDHVQALWDEFQARKGRAPTPRWVLARLDELLTSAGLGYNHDAARELAESFA